jgi:hypothetical protein
MTLMPYQQRVVEEKADLDVKREALNAFIGSGIFASVDIEEQVRLHHQAIHMAHYSHILGDRIAAFS